MHEMAPPFALADQEDKVRKIEDYRGRWLVVYFYPKDETPGCTAEACAFRDGKAELERMGVAIVGISRDSVASHAKFAEKYQLNFPLLADTIGDTVRAYGAWGNKRFFGRHFGGIVRTTVLVDPDGRIVRRYPKVSPLGHAEQIVQDLRDLTESGVDSAS